MMRMHSGMVLVLGRELKATIAVAEDGKWELLIVDPKDKMRPVLSHSGEITPADLAGESESDDDDPEPDEPEYEKRKMKKCLACDTPKAVRPAFQHGRCVDGWFKCVKCGAVFEELNGSLVRSSREQRKEGE
jgi:hypothetical protein